MLAISVFSAIKNAVINKNQNSKIINLIASQKGCHFARMTGSGSVCFGVFSNNELVKAAQVRVSKKYGAYWCKVGRTI